MKVCSTDKSQPDGSSSQPTSFSAVLIISAVLCSCRSRQRNAFRSLDGLRRVRNDLHCYPHALASQAHSNTHLICSRSVLPLPFNVPLLCAVTDDKAGDDDAEPPAAFGLLSAAMRRLCFSSHSLMLVSRSVKRPRSQSTVKLSTSNAFGCSLLPRVSSMRD